MLIAEKEYFYFQGSRTPVSRFAELYRDLTPSVYEVIRIMRGKPLFLEEHYERLVGSLASIGEEPPFSLSDLGRLLTDLASENGVQNHNARLVINGFTEEEKNVYLFLIPTSYPTPEMYEKGVKTDFLKAVRYNPHAKILNQSLRDEADALMKKEHLFEAILVNEKGQITEGSRSNIFFIRDGAVYTCPSEGVLLGVTRQRILRLCEEDGIPVRETFVEAGCVGDYQSAFISGTSPKVLPIASIGEQTFSRDDPTLCRIMALYDGAIERYLAFSLR